MEKKRLLFTYLPLVFGWTIDFLTKSWMMDNSVSWHQFGVLNLAYYENHGIIMGSFDHLPLMLRTVFLSTIGISIVASYPLLMGLIHFKSPRMVLGLSLLFGGILGNVTDRILYGFVVDMIYFKTSWFTTPVFNIADMIQWFAYALIASGFVSELNHHILDEERRSLQWINPKFQYKFCFTLVGIVFLATSVPTFFGLTFLKYSLTDVGLHSEGNVSSYLTSFFITSLFIQTTLCLGTIAIGKVISARIAGPLIGIKRYLKDTLEGKHYVFKLREKDDFKELEIPLTQINQRLAQLNSKLPEDKTKQEETEKKTA